METIEMDVFYNISKNIYYLVHLKKYWFKRNKHQIVIAYRKGEHYHPIVKEFIGDFVTNKEMHEVAVHADGLPFPDIVTMALDRILNTYLEIIHENLNKSI